MEGGLDYSGFLETKIITAPESGFRISEQELSPALKPHQKAAVLWALKGGRRALFESFGMGKTVQQLEWCRQVVRHEGGKALIVLPLGVRQEFRRDAAELLGMEPPEYVRTMAEMETAAGNILLTNYERVRDGDIDRMRTLNTTQSQRRKALHVCPLQLDIVDRLINRYSNPGDLVLDPLRRAGDCGPGGGQGRAQGVHHRAERRLFPGRRWVSQGAGREGRDNFVVRPDWRGGIKS